MHTGRSCGRRVPREAARRCVRPPVKRSRCAVDRSMGSQRTLGIDGLLTTATESLRVFPAHQPLASKRSVRVAARITTYRASHAELRLRAVGHRHRWYANAASEKE